MDAFAAALTDDPAKVEAFREKTREVLATDEKPETVQQEEVAESATSSVAKEPEKVEETETQTQERDEKGKFARTVPQEALHAERERRRALEQRLKDLEEAQKKPPTSFLDDEDRAFKERLDPILTEERARYFNLTVEMAKEKPGREDYDEIYEFMVGEIQNNPDLMEQIRRDPRPGEAIYRLGKVRKELAEVNGDLSKYREHAVSKEREKLTAAEVRIKDLERQLAERDQSEQKRKAIPQSLNEEPSASQKDDAFRGPTPLKDIVPKI